MRSKKTDVNEIAKKFGGGGHKNAAGILSEKSLVTIKDELCKLLP